MVTIGIGDKFKNLLHRKSIDEKVEEAFSSTGRESFSKKVWEANMQAQQKMRTEVPATAKAFLKRPEERYNPYYPGTYEGPYGSPHEEGPMTKDFDKVAPQRSEFGRFDEDMHAELSTSFEQSPSEPITSGTQTEIPSPREVVSDINRPVSLPAHTHHPQLMHSKKDTEGIITLSDIREVMDELREIREQNAVILEKLRAIERKLEKR